MRTTRETDGLSHEQVAPSWQVIAQRIAPYSDKGVYQTSTRSSIMKRRAKLLLGIFIVLGAALFVFAPIIPQTALGLWNVPSAYPYCGAVLAPPPPVSYFVSPLYSVFHSGVVYVPQVGSLGWIHPSINSGAASFVC